MAEGEKRTHTSEPSNIKRLGRLLKTEAVDDHRFLSAKGTLQEVGISLS